MVGNSTFHRWRNPQRSMNPAKVIEGKPERVGSLQVLTLLAKGVCKPRHAAHSHTDREILALYMRRANAAIIGFAQHRIERFEESTSKPATHN